ncbi:hypothetical protein ACFVZJ_15540 [Streptomyces sp. NPDC058322]|uniref:hypothetical protein n=1 Tax=Streptomyces sp. NPDC058322 TaxID=3346446 RepID=UPI0036E81A60
MVTTSGTRRRLTASTWTGLRLCRPGVCEIAGVDDSHLAALRQATDGGVVLDVGFINAHPHAIGFFGPTPTGLESKEVERVSDLLGDIDFRAALAALPSDDHVAGMLIGHGVEGPTRGPETYLRVQFDALREFCETNDKPLTQVTSAVTAKVYRVPAVRVSSELGWSGQPCREPVVPQLCDDC